MGRPKMLKAYLFEVNQKYGGPEEGGWWYDVGGPADVPKWAAKEVGFKADRSFLCAVHGRDLTHRLCQDNAKGDVGRIQKLLAILNADRRPITSILCDGVYRVFFFPVRGPRQPDHFPKYRPHYE